MSSANKTVVRRFYDAINAGRLEVIDEVIAESFVEHEAFLGMAPTGKTIAVPFADFVRFEDGKVVEHWGVTDSGAMMQQLS